MKLDHIRNFVIISHIDHGKSTLADRFLEMTGTVEARRMKPQYLDQLDLERERGITIKMAPVRMRYTPTTNLELITNNTQQMMNGHSSLVISHKSFVSSDKSSVISHKLLNSEYILNLIDTPGHSDFSYEVSRALAAVEGAVLLVDATQGIQAQTLSNFRMAKRAGLTIVGAVNKIDMKPPHIEKMIQALADLLDVAPEAILKISGKTGEGVLALLDEVVKKVPAPRVDAPLGYPRALIFDSLYDDHKGIVPFVRVFEGTFKANEEIQFMATRVTAKAKEVGYFSPKLKAALELYSGEIGYIATGVKEVASVKIGDTITRVDVNGRSATEQLEGYHEPAPVVFVSFYPDGATEFKDLEEAFARLRLNDAALNIEPESNEALGRGLRVGFLGQLHFEITSDRLKREFNAAFLTSFPSVGYRAIVSGKEVIVKQPQDWPEHVDKAFQPIIKVEILTPSFYLNKVLGLQNSFDIQVIEINNLGEHLLLVGLMPLAELIRDFDDQLKSVSAGFASFSYERAGEAVAEIEKLEIMIANEVEPALTRIVSRKDVEREARVTVERLKELLPKQQFAQALQAKAFGRIVARETIAAMKKDVTGYLYGGDRSRKMKLWKKQQRGKERLKETGRVNVPIEVFRELLKK